MFVEAGLEVDVERVARELLFPDGEHLSQSSGASAF